MTTWMLVEDEPDLYAMVLAIYETLGINGAAFLNGEDAVEWLEDVDNDRLSEEMPELALLDIRLPQQVSGMMVAARIRQSRYLNRIPIVLMTAYRLTPEEEQTALAQSGADMLIYKPLPSIPDFHRMMQDLLSRP